MNKVIKALLSSIITIGVLVGILCVNELISRRYVKTAINLSIINEVRKQENHGVVNNGYAPVIKVFYEDMLKEMRKINVGNKDAESIVFFGGRDLYAPKLKDEETLPAMVTQKTHKTTLNRAVINGSIHNAIYDLSNEFLFETLKNYKPPKYFVYFYSEEHLTNYNDMYVSFLTAKEQPNYRIIPRYAAKNGKLTINDAPDFMLPLYSTYTVRANHLKKTNIDKPVEVKFSNFKFKKVERTPEQIYANKVKMAKNFVDLAIEANKLIKARFPEATFVVVDMVRVFEGELNKSIPLPQEEIKRLEDNGIKVISSDKAISNQIVIKETYGSVIYENTELSNYLMTVLQ